MNAQFHQQYPQACNELTLLLRLAVSMEKDASLATWDVMEKLHCESAAQVLAGAVYACLAGAEEFDSSLIIAVNHSGRSAAVGAVAGALLGLRQGEAALPEFYTECLEPAELLRELADDLWGAAPWSWAIGCLMPTGIISTSTAAVKKRGLPAQTPNSFIVARSCSPVHWRI